MSKHTPGPHHIDAGPGSYAICDARGRVIADMRLPEDNGVPIKEVDGNAHLISAASDLLAACRKAMTCMSMDSNVRAMIRAAITKAEPKG